MGLFDSKQISTQQHLDIEDIRNDLVVLKNGTVSVVIETTSVNFDLLDSQEQSASIGTFAALLNSLNFPIQIVINTQQTDTSKYLGVLDEYKQKVSNSPLGEQVQIYQDFIRNLTTNTQILNKRFFAIIPTMTTLPTAAKSNPLKSLFGKQERIINLDELVGKAEVELSPKRDHLIKQFANMGLSARQLKNDELIKLYYSVYEPDKMGLEVMNIRGDNVTGAVVTSNIRRDIANQL
jgi:hypothetical protein